MQSIGSRQVGGSNPGRSTAGRANRPTSFVLLDPCSNPSEHKLLTPPPKKSDIQVKGIDASEPKNPLGDRFIGQNNDLVGHPISCLGVCYENDPQKGGVYNARACA